jgi:hypothetical protein
MTFFSLQASVNVILFRALMLHRFALLFCAARSKTRAATSFFVSMINHASFSPLSFFVYYQRGRLII